MPKPEEDPDIALAGSMLVAEGFSTADVASLRLHGVERVRNAIANCDNLQKRKKLRGERRAYIASAVKNGYSLMEAAERDLWPEVSEIMVAKLREVATADDFSALSAAYADSYGPLRARVVSVGDVRAMQPAELLHRLLNRRRTP